MKNERQLLLLELESTNLQWGILIEQVRRIQYCIEQAKYFVANPLELQKKYVDAVDFVKCWLECSYGHSLSFTNNKEMFIWLYSERKKITDEAAKFKLPVKLIKDKLSKIPKK